MWSFNENFEIHEDGELNEELNQNADSNQQANENIDIDQNQEVDEETDQDVAIMSYIVKFVFAYSVMLIPISSIFSIFELGNSYGAPFGIFIGAAMYAAGKFVRDHKRIPNKNEKSKMVWSSFIILWLLSISSLLIVVLVIDGHQGITQLIQLAIETDLTITVSIALILSLLYLSILSYSYGGYAKKRFNRL
jgi:hypothetical protein